MEIFHNSQLIFFIFLHRGGVSKERLQIRDRYVFHVPLCISNKEANVSVSVLDLTQPCSSSFVRVVKSPSTHSRYLILE